MFKLIIEFVVIAVQTKYQPLQVKPVKSHQIRHSMEYMEIEHDLPR